MFAKWGCVLALGFLSLGSSGCIKATLADGQISATRDASGAFDTIADYELARSAASAGLVQFEGMHRLRPNNQDALFLLVKGWAGYGFAFPEDDYEAAVEADNEDLATYHKKRARLAYERALTYGVEILKERDGGFDTAKRNDATIKAWLNKHFDDKKDAPILFWVGSAWLAKTNISKDDPAVVADLFIGVAILEHSVKLDPEYRNWGGTATLASYHARSATADMDKAKRMFDDVLQKTQRKMQIVLVNYASRYACIKGDKALYEKMLHEVLDTEDPDPDQRLFNAVAKRRAKRYLGKHFMQECGF